jgi:hypothetical protein
MSATGKFTTGLSIVDNLTLRLGDRHKIGKHRAIRASKFWQAYDMRARKICKMTQTIVA